jgi:RNA polymerase sigma-70 factor (ECF subfamily)
MVSIKQVVNACREVRLARRVAEGDRKAVEEFVDAYGGRVHALARRYADGANAEDLTQEIFIDLFRCIGNFAGRSQLSTWVYRVAVNHCLRFREKAAPPSLPYDDALQHAEAIDGDPVQNVARGELKEQVHAALDTLTDDHRTVVILHELHGLTYAECADALGVPIGTVKSRLSNAFRRLRTTLGGYVCGDEPVPLATSEQMS